MNRWRWIAATVGSLVVVVAAVLVLSQKALDSSGVEPSGIGGPFRLVDQTGAPVDERLLRGKWSAVFFGYTYCPDVCPTTLSNLGHAIPALGTKAGGFQVVFITVDPARDTPAALRSYLSSPSFPSGTLGLTGSPEQVAAAAKAYHVYFRKVPQGDSYTLDHSAVVYLMDPDGRFVRPLDVGTAPPDVARQILAAMNQG